MTSQKQLIANRLNAKKCTGPKTSSLTRFNAVKHGLTAKTSVLLGESEDGFKQICQDIKKVFNPKDTIQENLVAQIAFCLWRMKRGQMAEKAIINSYTNCDGTNWVAIFSSNYLHKLVRYETSILRQMSKAIKTLQEMHGTDSIPDINPG